MSTHTQHLYLSRFLDHYSVRYKNKTLTILPFIGLFIALNTEKGTETMA